MQGSTYQELRQHPASFLSAIDFDGFAMSLAIRGPQAVIVYVLDCTILLLPRFKPRYLMGVGKPPDIIGAVERGSICSTVPFQQNQEEMGKHLHEMELINIRNA
ncbi:MAG: tRNA-guanine transglycosylase [Candidatus Midichloria sp.]|nr:MAG: tRNA-guanine transglycosylase [Candidatus Midichloria sp.]